MARQPEVFLFCTNNLLQQLKNLLEFLSITLPLESKWHSNATKWWPSLFFIYTHTHACSLTRWVEDFSLLLWLGLMQTQSKGALALLHHSKPSVSTGRHAHTHAHTRVLVSHEDWSKRKGCPLLAGWRASGPAIGSWWLASCWLSPWDLIGQIAYNCSLKWEQTKHEKMKNLIIARVKPGSYTSCECDTNFDVTNSQQIICISLNVLNYCETFAA